MLPNLYIVGFQKCGSSALFDFLDGHPEISGTTPKETFFLTDPGYELYDQQRNIMNVAASWAPYLQAVRPVKYILEGSVCNFYQKTALEYIRNSADAKVIFILRNPVDRLISNFKYYQHVLIPTYGELSIERYVKLIREGALESEAMRCAIEHGRYSAYLDRWKAALAEEQILILGMKQLINDLPGTAAEIAKFLELDAGGFREFKKVNQSRKPKSSTLHGVLLRAFGGRPIPGKSYLRKIYNDLFFRVNDLQVADGFRKEMKMEYRDEFLSLSQYF